LSSFSNLILQRLEEGALLARFFLLIAEYIMADEDTRDKFKRAQSVSLDDAMEVGTSHIRQSLRKVGENNPNFIAQHVRCKLQEYTLVVCGGPRTGKSTLINAILKKKLAPVGPGFNPVTLENTCYKLDGVFPEILDEHTGVKRIDDD
jgi:hypothetical protein